MDKIVGYDAVVLLTQNILFYLAVLAMLILVCLVLDKTFSLLRSYIKNRNQEDHGPNGDMANKLRIVGAVSNVSLNIDCSKTFMITCLDGKIEIISSSSGAKQVSGQTPKEN